MNTKPKTFTTGLVEKPTTLLELEFNELKLSALITDIEKEILSIRAAKLSHHLSAHELAKTRLEEEKKAPPKSWWSQLFSRK
jgi:hypothetical protein